MKVGPASLNIANESLLELMPIGVYRLDNYGRCEFVNKNWCELTAMSAERATGLGWIEIIHPEDIACVREAATSSKAKNHAVTLDIRIVRGDEKKEERWVRASAQPLLAQDGVPSGYLGTFIDITEKRLGQITSEKLAASLLEAQSIAKVGNWELDLRTGLITSSAEVHAIFQVERPANHAHKDSFTKFCHPDDASYVINTLREAETTAASFSMYHRIVCEDGQEKVIHTRGNVETDRSGKSVRIFGTVQDVSEIKNVENLLVKSEAKFEDTFFNAPVGISLVSLQGDWLHVNPALSEIVGYSEAELLKMNVRDITLHDEAFKKSPGLPAEHFKSAVLSFEKRYAHKGGRTVWVQIHSVLIKDKNGQPTHFITHTLDISGRKEMERELDKSRSLFEGVFESSALGIGIADLTGRLIRVNPAFAEMLGYEPRELEGREFKHITHGDDMHIGPPQMKAAVEGKLPYVKLEKRYLHKDGSAIWILMDGVLLTRDGAPDLLVATITNITDAKKNANRLLDLNTQLTVATEAKSQFLANMSHEIRTPLNGVLGMAGLLLGTSLSPEQKEYAETIRSSGDLLLALINDILDFSKIEAGKLDLEFIDFELEELMKDVEKTQGFSAREKGLRLKRSIAPGLPSSYFKSDPTRLRQILTNLISNAIKFTEHGHVSIDVSFVGLRESKTVVKFQVIDTGIGIPKDLMSRMFKAFSQIDASTSRRFGGTGLGLSICKNLVSLLGGEIGVSSEQGKGSTFWFTVAMELGSGIAKSTMVSEESEDLAKQKNLHILLAEDNRVNQIIATKMLKKCGHSVEVVDNGLAAVEALRQGKFDLVLMDCQMPEMDGYDATRAIRASQGSTFQAIPIVALTANAMQGDREKCIEAGMSDYITKPIILKDLEDVLARIVWPTTKVA